MSAVPLRCTVRHCGSALERHVRSWTCPRGHTFDLARSGYVNLLQPHDRRSSAAGDAKASIDARSSLLAEGIGRAAIDAIVAVSRGRTFASGSVVADLGCGAGDLLLAIAQAHEVAAVGIDLSTYAIATAVRRAPELTWVVANVDRGIPLCDASASLLLSLHARRHPEEARRVIAPHGRLIVAVPAQDDLIELRREVLGEGSERDRAALVIAEHAPYFAIDDRASVRETHALERDALLRLLRATYRGARASAEDRIARLSSLEVTLASDVVSFRPM